MQAPGGPEKTATPADAAAFLENANATLLRLGIANAQTGWIAQNFITEDTEAVSDETQATEDTVADQPARAGLRNRRPSGKIRRPRLRRKSGGVTVEE